MNQRILLFYAGCIVYKAHFINKNCPMQRVHEMRICDFAQSSLSIHTFSSLIQRLRQQNLHFQTAQMRLAEYLLALMQFNNFFANRQA